MWTCPKCGRTFRNCNQSHYCGKAPETIEEYILGQPEEVQPILQQLQETIHASIPEAKEKISWSMPTFWKGRVKVHATFDGIPYDGSIVNMGVKNEDGSVCYILGMLKSIRTQLGKGDGDTVHIVILERTE